MKKTKEETKVSKPKITINIRKTVKKYIARPLAYIVLLTSASYGIRKMLETIQDPIALVLTILFVLGLAFILFDTTE